MNEAENKEEINSFDRPPRFKDQPEEIQEEKETENLGWKRPPGQPMVGKWGQ